MYSTIPLTSNHRFSSIFIPPFTEISDKNEIKSEAKKKPIMKRDLTRKKKQERQTNRHERKWRENLLNRK